VRRETQHVLLLLLGGALLRIAADDTHLRYVRPAHRWLLLGAGAVVVVLAVAALVHDRWGRAAPEPHDHDHDHDHDGGRHVPWLLLAPVLVIALVAPPALGADAVTRAGAVNAVIGSAEAFPPLADGAVLTVGEVVRRAAWDTSGSLDGREVQLTGFVVRRGAAVELARLTIACCAADARPHRVRLVGELGGPSPDTWLRVRGRVQSGSASAATGYVPTLTVTAADVVPAPPDPYEY
jgi:uncharacterized repeat protein (TIGR03943 family)